MFVAAIAARGHKLPHLGADVVHKEEVDPGVGAGVEAGQEHDDHHGRV